MPLAHHEPSDVPFLIPTTRRQVAQWHTRRTCERIVTDELWLSIFYFESWRFVTNESFMHERSSLRHGRELLRAQRLALRWKQMHATRVTLWLDPLSIRCSAGPLKTRVAAEVLISLTATLGRQRMP